VTAGAVERAAPTRSAVYVYGVVRAGDTPRVSADGVAGGEIVAIPSGGLAALAARVATPIRAKRRELLGHAAVLNEVASGTTVLPLRFGTTFRDEETVVRELLDARGRQLERLLADLDGKVELLVKAYYREDVVLREILERDARVGRLSARTRGRPEAATHADRLELGTAVAGAVEATTRADAAAILAELRPLALDVRLDETPVENQVIRASLLVERDRVPQVDDVLGRIAAGQAERMQFNYAGPLAPHSFVDLEAA
jgi:Gas vesicle synthesis protein GvpL/GvpF